MDKWFDGKPLNFQHFLCFSLYAANHAMNRTYAPILKDLGLTYPQYLAMISLWQNDGQSVGELSKALFLDSNTLTPLLKRLEALGLVSRQREKDDERRVRVTLTADGHALRERAECVPGQILEAIGIAPEDILALSAQINQVRENLSAGPVAHATPGRE